MKRDLKQLLSLLALCCLCQSAFAQDDSLYLDLGRVKLRKDFTQHITIKARDLEQMPFARLSDAIKPWLTGTFNAIDNVAYVVDGNVVSDADAWSIYDIEEISIVLNAEIQVSGSLKNQSLVLVKTRRKETQDKGLRVSGSSFLISSETPGGYSEDLDHHFYHQYHVTAWQNRKSVQYGLSANFLRDAYPQPGEYAKINSPMQLKRYQVNGWANLQLAVGHALEVQVNYTPQTTTFNHSNGSNGGGNMDYKARQTLLNPSIRLTNRIANHLTNELDASLAYARVPTKTMSTTIFTGPAYRQDIYANGKQDLSNLLIRERLRYNKSFGNWQLEPSLGFTFRSLDNEKEFIQVVYQNGQLQQTAGMRYNQDGEISVLTPTIALSFKNSFYMHGGIAALLSEKNPLYRDNIFPFVSVAIDVLRLAESENKYSLKLFVSNAKSSDFGDFQFSQADLPGMPDYIPGAIYGSSLPQYFPFGGEPKFRNMQGGLRFSLPSDRLVFSYNFDKRDFLDEFIVILPGSPGVPYGISARNFSTETHRLGVTAEVFKNPSRRWLTGIHTTATKWSAEGEPLSSPSTGILVGNGGKTLVTGGWVNRVEIRKFYFGLDMHYTFNQQATTVYGSLDPKSGYRISNLYVGYRLVVAKNKPLEIYISSRNGVFEDEMAYDKRRYYGAGFQLQLP